MLRNKTLYASYIRLIARIVSVTYFFNPIPNVHSEELTAENVDDQGFSVPVNNAKCALPEGWQPAPEHFRDYKHATLCNADLTGLNLTGVKWAHVDLRNAILTEVNFSDADLRAANLSGAIITDTDFSNADLSHANLRDVSSGYERRALVEDISQGPTFFGSSLNLADLRGADLSAADFNFADLASADLSKAQLSSALFSFAHLTGANFSEADLSNSNLSFMGREPNYKIPSEESNDSDAQKDNKDPIVFTGAVLYRANLKYADLSESDLEKTDLSSAVLRGANLFKTRLRDAKINGADFSLAHYAPLPSSLPSLLEMQGLRGLDSMAVESPEEMAGLVQMRDAMGKQGRPDAVSELTFTIEHNRLKHLFSQFEKCRSADSANDDIDRSCIGFLFEAWFRSIAFEMPTEFGLKPGRALYLIAALGFPLSFIYFLSFWKSGLKCGGVYRVWPADRVIDSKDRAISLAGEAKIERMRVSAGLAFMYGAYFSLLSAFSIGWRDFNVGAWLARIQANNYALVPVGWVRCVSGLQSLVSVYLVAMWALTYFGHPFE